MSKCSIAVKLINKERDKINQRRNYYFERNNRVDIFDYRKVLFDESNLSFSGNSRCAYGLEHILKRYSGYKKEPLVALEHGVSMPLQEDYYLNVGEYKNNDFPVLITCSESRANKLSVYSDKYIIPIGPYIQYAQTVYDEDMMAQVKQNLGKTLLVFPQHGCKDELCLSESRNFIEYIKKIKLKYEFDTVLVSVYYYDFAYGLHIPYAQEGWTIVTSGNIHNNSFLDYTKTFLMLSDHVVFQGYTSAVGYALSVGKPVLAYQKSPRFTAKSQERRQEIRKILNVPKCDAKGNSLYLDLFRDYSEGITQRQLEWAEECISLSIKRTPNEVYDIFSMAGELYWDCIGRKDKIINKYADKLPIDNYINEREH